MITSNRWTKQTSVALSKPYARLTVEAANPARSNTTQQHVTVSASIAARPAANTLPTSSTSLSPPNPRSAPYGGPSNFRLKICRRRPAVGLFPRCANPRFSTAYHTCPLPWLPIGIPVPRSVMKIPPFPLPFLGTSSGVIPAPSGAAFTAFRFPLRSSPKMLRPPATLGFAMLTSAWERPPLTLLVPEKTGDKGRLRR